MDLRKPRNSSTLVQESGISELEVTEGEEKVRLQAPGGPGQTCRCRAPTAPIAAPAPAAAPRQRQPGLTRRKATSSSRRWSAPSPPIEPRIDPLSRSARWSNEGETMCIIEARAAVERDRGGRIRHDQGHPGRKTPGGRVRLSRCSSLGGCPCSRKSSLPIAARSRCRSSAPGAVNRACANGGQCTRKRTAKPVCQARRRIGVHRPGRFQPELPERAGRSFPPPRSPLMPKPSTRAMVSFPRMPTSPSGSNPPASPSSARVRKPSAGWATRSAPRMP